MIFLHILYYFAVVKIFTTFNPKFFFLIESQELLIPRKPRFLGIIFFVSIPRKHKHLFKINDNIKLNTISTNFENVPIQNQTTIFFLKQTKTKMHFPIKLYKIVNNLKTKKQITNNPTCTEI